MTSFTLQSGIENLTYSGTAAFTATGNDSANTITTGSGSDIVWAGIGNDSVSAGSGADRLMGEAGDDTLTGGAGADRLEGGSGHDILIGGTESDIFVLDLPTATSTDRIIDFSIAQGDKLAVYGSDYGLAPGALAVDWFEILTSASAVGTKAHGEFIYNTATKTLSWDVDGHGAALAIALTTFDTTISPHFTDLIVL
jgi:Ca2+-binding RTX toxin-like protein